MTSPTPSQHCQPMTAHTPTPWRFCRPFNVWRIFPESAMDDGIDYFVANVVTVDGRDNEAKANAALIVEAVNSYASLKARIEELEDLVRSAFNEGLAQGVKEFTSPKGGYSWAHSKAQAALQSKGAA